MDISTEKNMSFNQKPELLNVFRKKTRTISDEDREIVMALSDLKREMNSLHSSLDNVVNPDLIDAHIYEIKAVNLRYKYYLEICKKKGIVADVF